MRRLLAISTLLLFACGSVPSPAPPEPSPTSTTTTTTTSTMAIREIDYSVVGCRTPPVTFALLCEVYALIERHHVDSPFDPADLAAGMALGVQGVTVTGEGDDFSRFDCAIPDPAFETTCTALAEKLASGPVDVRAAIEVGVEVMVTLSLDPFSHYLPPELAGALTPDGVVPSVGLVLAIRNQVGSQCRFVEAECRLEITAALPEGPGQLAGLQAADVITAIDGAPVLGWTLVAAATALDGEDGTPVTIEVRRNGASRTFDVARQSRVAPPVEAEMIRPGLAYVRLPDFDFDVPFLLHEILASSTDLDQIVVDLRDNPGGFIDAVTLVASEFLPDGSVLQTAGTFGSFDYPVQPGGLATRGVEVHVVVNGASASAAEVLAAVLQERGRARIHGEATFGKDTVQIGFPLRNDGELRMTVARWTTPAGASVAGSGVVPDRLVDVPAGADPQTVVDLILGR